MAVTKLSVSVDQDLAEAVKAAAADEGVTVSAWLADAASARIRNRFLGVAVEMALNDTEHNDELILKWAAEARARAIVTCPTGT